MPELEESAIVVYTTKELLERLDHKLDAIDGKLDSKAETVQLDALADRVARIEAWKNRAIGVAVGVGAVAGGAAARLVEGLGNQ